MNRLQVSPLILGKFETNQSEAKFRYYPLQLIPFVRGSGKGGGSGGEGLTLNFERMRGEGATKIEHVQIRGKGGPNFVYFAIT